MLRRNFAFALAASALLALIATDASAAAQRTFVASYGSAGNTAFNCSIVKPCRAFSEAIGVTNDKGEVIVLDSAGYGTVTITQSVSIIAPAGIYAGISVFSGDGITVNAPGAIVVLRGLTINGQGGVIGIRFQTGARLRVENCAVSGMSSAGISHNAPSGEMIVLDSITRDNGGRGIDVNGDALSMVLDHVRSEHNQYDGFYLTPTAGSSGATATIANSLFAHNGGEGIKAISIGGSTVTIVVERTVMAGNVFSGFYANSPPGSSLAATIARNTGNDNHQGGVVIVGDGNIQASILSNAVHRNSVLGFQFDGVAMKLVMKDNVAVANGGSIGDIRCIIGGSFKTDKSNVLGTVPDPVSLCASAANSGF